MCTTVTGAQYNAVSKIIGGGDDRFHYRSHLVLTRSPWLRAMILGASDGLVSVASLMLGVGAGTR